jgi:glucosylglycerate synthase
MWDEVRQQVGEIGKIDVVVGIPTFNNATTVEPVAKAVTAGVAKVCSSTSVLIVNADAGSQDGTPEAFRQAVGPETPWCTFNI